jgi:cytochrome P450
MSTISIIIIIIISTKMVCIMTATQQGVSRVLDKPVNVGGYEVPPGVMIFMSMYVTNQKPENFPHPTEFLPERWLTEDRKTTSATTTTTAATATCEHAHRVVPSDLKKPNPFAHLPFGFGPRICQAFRLAELEAFVMLIKLVQNFRWTTENTVEPYVDLFIHPDRDLQIKWEPLHP